MKKINYHAIIISGPTASGKTSLSLELGKHFKEQSIDCCIVNFDSLLFYRELNIGTAKPTIKELELLPYKFINNQSVIKPINAADFIKDAQVVINELIDKNIVPIIVGGSAFYLRALIKGMYQGNKPNEGLVDYSKKIAELITEDNSLLINYLKENDKESLDNIHVNDQYRLSRAVQFHLETGTKISDQKKKFDQSNPYDFSKNNNVTWSFFHIYLNPDKIAHQEIIRERVDQMIEAGLVKEVEALLANGLRTDLKPLQSIGYKETISYLNNEIKNIEDLKERITISTRQLAKSQRTFFQKITPKYEMDPLSVSDLINPILSQIKIC